MLSQSQLMEIFDFIIIVLVREVLLLEIFMELFPDNLPFIYILYFPEVLPPYGCYSNQIEDGYSSLHIYRVVLYLEILSHPKNPSFSFLTIIYLTIEGRRPCLLKFIMWTILVVPLSLILLGHTPQRSLRWVTPRLWLKIVLGVSRVELKSSIVINPRLKTRV